MAINPPLTPRPVASLADTAMTTQERPLPAEPAHASPPNAVSARLHVEPERGLTQAEAARRLVDDGPNELAAPPRPSVLGMLWHTVTEPFILVLVAAGALAVILGETRDGLLILAGVVPIVAADVVTGYRAERALEALRAASAPTARVRRDGMPLECPAREVVVGDILLLSSGDVVAADARVISSQSALVDRAILTGESLPEPAVVLADPVDASLAERRSVVFSGTSIVGGSAEAVVVATGARLRGRPDLEVPWGGGTASLAAANRARPPRATAPHRRLGPDRHHRRSRTHSRQHARRGSAGSYLRRHRCHTRGAAGAAGGHPGPWRVSAPAA